MAKQPFWKKVSYGQIDGETKKEYQTFSSAVEVTNNNKKDHK